MILLDLESGVPNFICNIWLPLFFDHMICTFTLYPYYDAAIINITLPHIYIVFLIVQQKMMCFGGLHHLNILLHRLH